METILIIAIVITILSVLLVILFTIGGTSTSGTEDSMGMGDFEEIIEEFPRLVGYGDHEHLIKNSVKSIDNPDILRKFDEYGITYTVKEDGEIVDFKTDGSSFAVDFDIAKRIAETAGKEFKFIAISAINEGTKNIGGYLYIMKEYVPQSYLSVSQDSNKCNKHTSKTCGYSVGDSLESRKYAVYQLFD